MQKYVRSILLLIVSFVVLIIINEVIRIKNERNYERAGIKTINPSSEIINRCSWKCHDDTNYCKRHHVKFIQPFFKTTDLIYFEVIRLLALTGNYGLANIAFLVLTIPLFIWYFLIKSINIQFEINKIKSQK